MLTILGRTTLLLASRESPPPLAVEDFLKYLDIVDAFPKKPNVFRVTQILERMESTGVLMLVRHSNDSFGVLGRHYIHFSLGSEVQRDQFRLGPELVPLHGAIFQAPVVAQTVYTLGYPKLPFSV